MSPNAISPGQPYKRPERACLACRKNKTRCSEVGDSADARCLRCRTIGAECEFLPLRKLGRPPRALIASPVRLPVKLGHATEGTGEVEGRDIGVEEQYGHGYFSEAHPWQLEEPGTVQQEYAVPDVSTGLPDNADQQLVSFPQFWPPSSPTTAACDPADFDFDALLAQLYHAPSPALDLGMLSQETALHASVYDIPNLARQYLAVVHIFLPLLPPNQSQLVQYLSTAPLALLVAISSIINPTTEIVYTLPAQYSLADLQSSLFAIHVAYGRGDTMLARSILKWSCAAVQHLGWHTLDSCIDIVFNSWSEEQLDAIRRVWHEIWSLDIMLSVLTGAQAFLKNVAYIVNLPDEPSGVGASAFSLRIRALALLSTCTALPTGTPVAPAHLRTLATVGQNIAILSRDVYAASSDVAWNPKEAAAREQAFTASLVSSCAIIYLYTS